MKEVFMLGNPAAVGTLKPRPNGVSAHTLEMCRLVEVKAQLESARNQEIDISNKIRDILTLLSDRFYLDWTAHGSEDFDFFYFGSLIKSWSKNAISINLFVPDRPAFVPDELMDMSHSFPVAWLAYSTEEIEAKMVGFEEQIELNKKKAQDAKTRAAEKKAAQKKETAEAKHSALSKLTSAEKKALGLK
jgi:hypothetical protein